VGREVDYISHVLVFYSLKVAEFRL